MVETACTRASEKEYASFREQKRKTLFVSTTATSPALTSLPGIRRYSVSVSGMTDWQGLNQRYSLENALQRVKVRKKAVGHWK